MKEQWKIKIALLAIAVLNMGALAVTAGIAQMADAFPDIPLFWIQMVTTIPIILQVPMTILSGLLCTRFSKKKMILTACMLFLIGGLTPYFIRNFWIIAAMRALYGVAIGLEMPVATSLTLDFFEGEERASLMGYSSATGMLGGMFYTYIGGMLSAISWEKCFLAYLIGVPVLILVALFLPDTKLQNKTYQKKAEKIRLHPEIFLISLISLIYIVLYFAYTNNISLFVANTGLGNSAQSGMSYSIVNGCGFLAGLIFGKLSSKIRHLMVPLSIVITAMGFFIVGFSTNLPILYFGSVFLGVGLALFLPETYLLVGEVTDANSSSFAIGLTSAVANAGQFLSALLLAALSVPLCITDEKGMLLLGGWGCIILAAISIIYLFQRKRLRKQ